MEHFYWDNGRKLFSGSLRRGNFGLQPEVSIPQVKTVLGGQTNRRTDTQTLQLIDSRGRLSEN